MSITGSIASAPKVFDTAISVTSAGLRCASRQARAISARTCSRLVEGAAAMRRLYRTIPPTSNERLGAAVQCPASDGGRRRTIRHFKYAVLLTNRLADEQPLSVLQSSLGRRLPLRYGVLGRLFGADFFVNLFDPIERKDVMAGFRVAFGRTILSASFVQSTVPTFPRSE